MKIIEKAIKLFIYTCPDRLYSLVKKKRYDWTEIDKKRDVFRCKFFCIKLFLTPARVKKQIAANKKIIEIKKGSHSYTYFNMSFLNNALSLALYSMYRGGIPRIVINKTDPNSNKWNWYFKQPEETFFAGIDTSDFKIETCDIVWFGYMLSFTDIWHLNSFKYLFWRKMYQLFAVINEETKQYVEEEVDQLGVDISEIPGVLYRGTDYISTKPKFHPVQPSPDELVNILKNRVLHKDLHFMYCATDEKRFFDFLTEQMKQYDITVLSNRNRDYYDGIYYGNDAIERIGQVRFDRDNDNYLKGIRYLSSIIILSRCKQIIAASSGGTLGAMLFRTKKTKKPEDIIINLGLY